MACHAHLRIERSQRRRRQEAASLLIWIAVLAVMAILLSFMLPALIREVDHRVARDETAALKTFGNALRAAIQRHGYIPAHTSWTEMVAEEAGFNLAAVATNPRHQPRLLLIDTNGWFSQVSLSYTQSAAGSLLPPLNARMMIISSVGRALPVSAGPLSATEFMKLWNAAEGTASFPTTGLWAGWGGRSDDVKIERVNLSSLFVSVGLETYASDPAPGQYAFGSGAITIAPYQNSQFPNAARYYLQGTMLHLYNSTNLNSTLDSRQLLTQDGWFLYQNQVWRSSAGRGNMPGGVDISGVVLAFLNAVPNTQALNGADQQRQVVGAMMNYMSNYNTWAEGGFTDDALKAYLVNTVQPSMIATFQDIFQGSYYPTNASGPK
jgi:type II secretory pathway pseudopilin PulG